MAVRSELRTVSGPGTGPATRPGVSVFSAALLATLGLGIAVRVVNFGACRSLGLDEARLAVSIAARSYGGFLAPLDLDQSAPLLFLWGERVMVDLFGLGDCVLRILPLGAGIAAALLMYPFAKRFLETTEAGIASMIGILCPLLITYSVAVKQYSVEVVVAIVLLLAGCRSDAHPEPRRDGRLLLAGTVAPWLSLTAVFVLSALWLNFAALAARGRKEAGRMLTLASILWGLSCGVAYLVVYRAPAQNLYMRRFWELAFLTPTRPAFLARSWKTAEDIVWGFVTGDPLVVRTSFQSALDVMTALALAFCALGIFRVLRSRGKKACWYLCGPCAMMFAASALGAFPIAPRLALFAVPIFIVLFVAGLAEAVSRLGARWERAGVIALGAAVLLPLEFLAVVRGLAREPAQEFRQLVRELHARRKPGEPVYVFARSLPPWIYYSTDWTAPDSLRLRSLIHMASAGGAAFENTPSRSRVREDEGNALVYSSGGSTELLGLPSGMEWRQVAEHVRLEPDTGWVEVEAKRIQEAAAPAIWLIASAYYAPETNLFWALERRAVRRTFAHLGKGIALVRYEFVPKSVQLLPASLGRLSTSAKAGR